MGKPASQEEQTLYRKLAEIVSPENVITDTQMVTNYNVDGLTPGAVIFASATEQVSQIITAANQSHASIIPWGSGSKQQVGPCLSQADVVLCLKKMNRIIELDTSNFTTQIEAGIINGDLQKQLAKHQLFFPLDPPCMEISTIGGELATNASGPLRAGYGTARDIVLGITAVTPTGDIVHTGGKTMKNVAGIDLCKMFLGSWGTLGIITEVVLRTSPLPEVSKSLCLTFAKIENAGATINQLLHSPLTPTSVELLDEVAEHRLDYNYGSHLTEGEVMLLIAISGGTEEVERHLTEIKTIAEANKARHIAIIEGQETARIWNAYREIHQLMLNATASTLQGKASVPISKLGDMFKAVKKVGANYSTEIGIRAHGYNGILYPYVIAGDNDATRIVGDLRQAAVDLAGQFTVEFAPLWVRNSVNVLPDRGDYTLMKQLKTEFDPNNILNPGRVVGGLY
ncbi:FAD-binding oxidoreductase [Chloroflexota bacterium]